MTLETIMTKHVVTVSMDDTLGNIRDMFERFKFHHVVVVDDCKPVGVISDRDLLKHLSPFVGKVSERPMDAASLKKKAHQVMSRDLIAATPQTPIAEAAIMLMHNGISCLPVLADNGACIGIVTWRDLLRWSLEHMAVNPCAPKDACACNPSRRAA